MKAILSTLNVFSDERGSFLELYKGSDYLQDNLAYRKYGVICGLHFQRKPYEQAKLVTCLYGEILDVVVDLETMEIGKFILSSNNHAQLYVPRGYAHGYAVLSPYAIIHYKCDNKYYKDCEGKIQFDSLGIDWLIPKERQIVSKKDKL